MVTLSVVVGDGRERRTSAEGARELVQAFMSVPSVVNVRVESYGRVVVRVDVMAASDAAAIAEGTGLMPPLSGALQADVRVEGARAQRRA